MPSDVRIELDLTEDRPFLIKMIAPGGRCDCGEPAVVRYYGKGDGWKFDWSRCGTCPGVRVAQGCRVVPTPMEEHHRSVLDLLGDEAAFVAALRLGYRPESYDDEGATRIDGRVENFSYFLGFHEGLDQ